MLLFWNIAGTLETRKNSCDPPDISVAILQLKDLNPPFTSLDFVQLPIDFLLSKYSWEF